MNRFAGNLAGGLRRFAMAGVGAVTLTVDKSKEVFDHLAEKGEAASIGNQIDAFQKKMSAQLHSFARNFKSDCDSAGIDRLTARCMALSPEQKAALIEKLTAEPAPAEEQTPVCEEEEPAEDTAPDSPPAASDEPVTDEYPTE